MFGSMSEGYIPSEVILAERHGQTVKHNLEMCKQEMWALLSAESWGGNAGCLTVAGEKLIGGVANGYLTKDGVIQAFGNSQHVAKQSGWVFFSFHCGFIFELKNRDSLYNSGDYIIDMLLPSDISKEGEKILKETRLKYNLSHVRDWRQLRVVVSIENEIEMTDGKRMTAEGFIKLVDDVEVGSVSVIAITRKNGWRDKVVELLGQSGEAQGA